MKLFKTKTVLALFLGCSLMPVLASASEAGFEYPELSVVPRATDRIILEAQKDREQRWRTHLPTLIPALGNILAGTALLVNGTRSDLTPSDTSSKAAPWVGIGVGIAWTGIILGVVDKQDFYQEGIQEAARIQVKSQRDQLLRERLAEESIQRAGTLARKIKWMSAVTNLGAAAFMAGAAKEKSFSRYVAFGAAATALVPFLFPTRWEKTDSIHKDYKRRIYAPMAGVTLLPDPIGNSWAPGLSLALRF
jgi:hypothetical protein